MTAGLNMEGLFRVPGPAAYTDELRRAFEEGTCIYTFHLNIHVHVHVLVLHNSVHAMYVHV